MMFRGEVNDETNASHSMAYCELYLAFAYLFRRFDIREDTTK